MGDKTEIQWCDSTINPTTGCEGCELWNGRDVRHCYAGGLHEGRLANSYPSLYASDFQEVRLAPGRMMKAARWSDLRGKERPGKPWLNRMPRMIFVGDMGDFMSRSVPENYIVDEILGAIKSPEGSRHFWMLLTKQIARLAALSIKLGGLPENVMAMTTVTNQTTANARVPELLKVMCSYRGISAEPLLGPVEIFHFDEDSQALRGLGVIESGGMSVSTPDSPPEGYDNSYSGIDLVIGGGESGPGARFCYTEYARSLRDQCVKADVPFFWKQWGEYLPDDQNPEIGRGTGGIRVGKKAAGRHLDGRTWDQFPERLTA
jgi:protein gp37